MRVSAARTTADALGSATRQTPRGTVQFVPSKLDTPGASEPLSAGGPGSREIIGPDRLGPEQLLGARIHLDNPRLALRRLEALALKLVADRH